MSSPSRARGTGGEGGAGGPDGARLRIYHGPKNITGIGRYLADWQRSRGARADFIVYEDDTTRQNNHRNLHLERKSRLGAAWAKIVFTAQCIGRYDVFHFYFGESLLSFGLRWPLPINLDLPLLRRSS
jgi:hypothetical protein